MVRASAETTGSTSVTLPTTVSRAARRARSRWRATWSRMMSICSRTLTASGSAPRAVASFTITDSGVFSACARLPTCARALDDLPVGVDQRIGLPRERRDLGWELPFQPLGSAAPDCSKALGNAFERQQTEANLKHRRQQQRDNECAEGHDKDAVERARL